MASSRYVYLRFLGTGRPPCTTIFPYTPLFRSLELVSIVKARPPVGRGQYVFGMRARSRRPATLPRRTLGDAAFDQLRSEEHTSELQSHVNLVCRLLLEKKN